MIVHSGTATSGTTTSLADTTKNANPCWTHGTAIGRFIGFVVEVESSAGVWERRVANRYTDATQTLTWAVALGVSASGKAYRIREPKWELNRWQDRELTITYPGGTSATTTIRYSDDAYLWFDAVTTPITAGCTVSVTTQPLGGVWMRSGGKWITPPTSTNAINWYAAAGGVAQAPKLWSTDQWAIAPTIVNTAGRYRRGDYYGKGLIDDLTTAANKLKWPRSTPSFNWTATDVNGVVHTDTQRSAGAGGVPHATRKANALAGRTISGGDYTPSAHCYEQAIYISVGSWNFNSKDGYAQVVISTPIAGVTPSLAYRICKTYVHSRQQLDTGVFSEQQESLTYEWRSLALTPSTVGLANPSTSKYFSSRIGFGGEVPDPAVENELNYNIISRYAWAVDQVRVIYKFA